MPLWICLALCHPAKYVPRVPTDSALTQLALFRKCTQPDEVVYGRTPQTSDFFDLLQTENGVFFHRESLSNATAP